MGLLRGFRSLLAFLTIIPIGGSDVSEAARYMPLFPFIGLLIGSLAGLLAWSLRLFAPEIIVGVLTLGFLLLLTGLHHTDGLIDFGDGLMRQGTFAEKIKAMHDGLTGAGGLALGLVTLLTTALAISSIERAIIIQSLVVSEASAKASMALAGWLGRSAHEGLNTAFIREMHKGDRPLRLAIPLLISYGVAIPIMGLVGMATVTAALVGGLLLVGISNRHFNGICGDVFGAINDLTRMASLLLIVVITG